MEDFLIKAKESSRVISQLTSNQKNEILLHMAKALRDNSAVIIQENKRDLADADRNNLSSALRDRLLLDTSRIDEWQLLLKR